VQGVCYFMNEISKFIEEKKKKYIYKTEKYCDVYGCRHRGEFDVRVKLREMFESRGVTAMIE
jgi:hypothetical protein